MGLIKLISDGRSMNIWNDNWLPKDHAMWPVCATSVDPSGSVSEILCATTRTWDIQKLQQHFILSDIEVIRQIPINYMTQSGF